jgi:hypothetical protein
VPGLFEIVDAGFRRAERTPDAAVTWRHPTIDGREATVRAGRLCVAALGEPVDGDGWYYATPMGAVLAAARWIEGGCAGEPDGWTRHPPTGRSRFGGGAASDETAWVCPRHPDRLPAFHRGRMFCAPCGRALVDAIKVPWPPPAGAGRR